MRRNLTILLWATVVLLALLCPFFLPRYQLYLLAEVMLYAIYAISYYLLLGQTGILSFGHAAYFGLGAYTTALCLIHLPVMPVLASIFAGSLCGLLGGLLVGAFLLRLSKFYLALGTLAFAQLLWAIAWTWRGLTGGDDGLIGWAGHKIAFPFLGSLGISNMLVLYYLILCFSVGAILLCWFFTRTPLGNTLACLKSNSDRAQFLGTNIYQAKFILFGYSAFIAALSGSLYTLLTKMVSPKVFDMETSFDVVVISVIGGYTKFAGPILGSFLYVYLREYLAEVTARWQLIMGIIFISIVLYYPDGLIQLFESGFKRINRSLRQSNA